VRRKGTVLNTAPVPEVGGNVTTGFGAGDLVEDGLLERTNKAAEFEATLLRLTSTERCCVVMVRSALSSWHVQINGVTRAGLLGKHRTPVLFNTTTLLGSGGDQLFARGAISVGPTFMDCAQA
jgi:hypothetical protein